MMQTQMIKPDNYDQEVNSLNIRLGKFVREKSIEKYIYQNIHSFMKLVFDEEVIYAKRQEHEIIGCIKVPNGVMPKRGQRLDLYVKTRKGNNYIIEVKKEKPGQYDSVQAIGQILYYSTKFPDANKLVIVSTLYNEGYLETLKKYNLPIDFVLIGRDSIYLLKQ